MLIATSSKADRLLLLTYVGHIKLEELARQREAIKAMLGDLLPRFRLLADFTHFKSMEVDCVPEMGRLMEMLDQSRLESVVRVIPDPRRDPGMKILAFFHYKQHPKVITCGTFVEAAQALSL
jgi:hypothetical protein